MLKLTNALEEESFHRAVLQLPHTCALLITQNGYTRAVAAQEITEVIDLLNATVISVIDLTTYRSEYKRFLLAFQNARIQIAKEQLSV